MALKFLPEELAEDPTALRRLEREAQTASALNHPNICTIYDIEEYEGQPFIAMELLEGEALQQRLAASAPGAVPATLLVDIAMQLCLGLEAAHGKAIVHRDIKPANIFLTNDATVKLLDFGIAKLFAGHDGDAAGRKDTTSDSHPQQGLTRNDVTVGTSGYMSPEQVRREDLEGRSDLFSLGLVLYEMATGLRAFTGTTAVAVQEAILSATPPAPESLNAALPRALARVIAKAIEKDRSLRYQNAAEMRQDLERARQELQPSGMLRRRGWLIAAAILLASVAVGVWLSSRGRAALAPSDTIVLAHLTNHTGDRVFDEALYTALRISLEQTPYLNVLADNKVQGTLASMKLDQNTRITPEVALQVCRQTGSKIVLAPSIADADNQLRLELRAIDCQSGSLIKQIANEGASRDGVVDALGTSQSGCDSSSASRPHPSQKIMRPWRRQPAGHQRRWNCWYLESGDAGAAAAEFQKVLVRRGLVGRGVIGSLARLQLARAQSATNDTGPAIGSYEAFLDLWRDADADIPVYIAAKSEYEELRNGRGLK